MSQGVLITGVVLAAFGLLFALGGRSGERGYWTDRDPQEVAGADDTTLREVSRNLWDNALHGKRPSLRMMAIGMILVIVGIALVVLALLSSVLV